MSLASGSRLGVYEILGSRGAGGMDEVYRARDSRLNRDVALKVLPDALADDTDRLARLHREAQVLASPSHPNIAIVHGFEEGPAKGAESPAKAGHYIHALVMEFATGAAVNRLRMPWLPTANFSSSSRRLSHSRLSRSSPTGRRVSASRSNQRSTSWSSSSTT